MKDYWNIRIRLVLIVLIVVVFALTIHNTDSTIKNEFETFYSSIKDVFDFFGFLFKGNILFKPSGAQLFYFFITLVLIFLPAFILLYGNNLVHVRDSNRIIFLSIYIACVLATIYFTGYLLINNLFTFEIPEIVIIKEKIAPDSWKFFERFLNFLTNKAGDSFRFKNWFLLNFLILISTIYRSLFKMKEPDFASFGTSFFFEILRIFILVNVIKYIIFLMTIKVII
ncbi:MAG: hypothetical protein PHV06_07150 [bacterium]|nr:hypothetical protein [bacterium]